MKERCPELFTLTIEQFAQVLDLGIPLEALFVLECLIQGTNPGAHLKTQKIGAINQLLTRKGYLSKEGVTTLGKKTYESLLCEGTEIQEVVKVVKAESKSKFDEWWDSFPLHDGFSAGYQVFPKTRTLRAQKGDCLSLFTKIVASGENTAEEIIHGTRMHISNVKNKSVREKKNCLSFVHNTATYLRNRDYAIWIGETSHVGGYGLDTTVNL